MPRPTNDTLMRRLSECQAELSALQSDDQYSGQNTVYTYKAMPFQVKRHAESARFVVVARVEKFTETLLDHGAEWLINSIRRTVNLRAPQVLFRSRWTSESEIVFLLSAEPERFIGDLKATAKNEGISLSIAYVPYSGHIHYDHDRAVEAFHPVKV